MSSSDLQNDSEKQPEVTLEEALELAQGHHQSGNFILAERTYRDILKAVPDHFPTTQFLGVLLFQSGNYDDALYYLDIAVKAEPDNAHCLNNYGGVLAQMSRYEEALKYYDRALKIEPNYLDAINNKAFGLWRSGEYKESERLSRRALELDPDNILALNGLGMVLAKLVKFEESIDIWKKASKLNPEESMFWINWGNTLREMGRLKESEKKCRKAVELAPDNPEALNNLGNVLRDNGKLDESAEFYRRATNARPEYFEAHVNMAIAFLDNHLYEDASIAAKYAVAFNRDFGMGYSVLSKALCELGVFDQAHMSAQRAIHLDPDQAEPYLDLANVLSKMDQYDDAEASIQEALKQEPDQARAYMQLSEIRERINNYDGAREAIEQALEMSPDMPMLWVRKGLISFFDDAPEEGLEYVEKAIQLSPEWHVPLQHKAEMLISLNRNDEAEVVIRKLLTKKKDIPGPYSTLTSLKKFKSEKDPDFVQMKKLEDKVDSHGQLAAAVYHYSMSDVYEQMKKYDEAFDHLKKASDIKRKVIHYIKKTDEGFIQGLKERYSAEFLKNFEGLPGCSSKVPVFIVGMPRSGTTLTEQIISSHPDVYGAGELPDLGQILKDCRSSIEIAEIESLGQRYVDNVSARAKGLNPLRVTDKMPGNYVHIGLISILLPQAKIIHCRRNPMDTSLSCYKQNFAQGQYWSYDLEELGNEYLSYLDIMAHWRDVLPDSFLEIDYEETVENFEEQARKLIDYVGLPWHDACLEPHKQKRTVLTASKAQVTKPVYKTSVDKWKRYEKHLQPLVKKLLPDQALPEEKPKKKKAKKK